MARFRRGRVYGTPASAAEREKALEELGGVLYFRFVHCRRSHRPGITKKAVEVAVEKLKVKQVDRIVEKTVEARAAHRPVLPHTRRRTIEPPPLTASGDGGLRLHFFSYRPAACIRYITAGVRMQ